MNKIQKLLKKFKMSKDVSDINPTVSTGVEPDGFRSLEQLDISQVLDNKDLIIKAYEQDGFRALKRYIQHTLSPVRTKYYICHGETHDYTVYDEKYAEVQKALMEDTTIYYIFKKEEQLAKERESKREARTTTEYSETVLCEVKEEEDMTPNN